jgi:phosphatidylglycerophosphate synthase
MFDTQVRRFLDPPLDRAGRALARAGVSANTITALALVSGIAAAFAVAAGQIVAGLALFLAGRVLDGLDGAVARATRKTDLGGFLDIVSDFGVYAAIPLGFALLDPASNALPAAILLGAFYFNGAAFLTFAIFAARRRIDPSANGPKSFFFLGGLAEGVETIAIFVAMFLFPAFFFALAYGFAALCCLSAIGRILAAGRMLRDE